MITLLIGVLVLCSIAFGAGLCRGKVIAIDREIAAWESGARAGLEQGHAKGLAKGLAESRMKRVDEERMVIFSKS